MIFEFTFTDYVALILLGPVFNRGALTVGCDSRKSGRTQSYSKKITHTQSILVYILGTEISCHRRMEP